MGHVEARMGGKPFISKKALREALQRTPERIVFHVSTIVMETLFSFRWNSPKRFYGVGPVFYDRKYYYNIEVKDNGIYMDGKLALARKAMTNEFESRLYYPHSIEGA